MTSPAKKECFSVYLTQPPNLCDLIQAMLAADVATNRAIGDCGAKRILEITGKFWNSIT
jgi:hypothetical protein